ncbi:MAG: NrfD/PsrC family molybdoenzyme membrane anchor subunit [Desulfobacterales bacterium]|nr:NrfD/PsrC family molybdoenzyme membrane anchor subunit [Desulfobacterales bacterium]
MSTDAYLALPDEENIFKPLTRQGSSFYLIAALCLGLIATGVYAYLNQLFNGLGVTGMNQPVTWGVYITNFIFFIGISHAGTLISSILRIAQAEFRRPFTRAAEALTVFSLPFGALSVIVDLGRPGRLLNMIRDPQFLSPLVWDMLAVTTYLTFSSIYFYLALIPDIAECRDRLKGKIPGLQYKLYRMLALGWTGDSKQWRVVNFIMSILCVLLFMVVISVHTNVSFVFVMTLQPGWQSAIIAPYFVVGAIYSGVAFLVVIMATYRKVYKLQALVTDAHFNQLARFLTALVLFWFYFTFIEFLSVWYHNEPVHLILFNLKFYERYAVTFWVMITFCFIIPICVFPFPRMRKLPIMVVTCIIVNIGMWLERWLILIPNLTRPRLPYLLGSYGPSWVEIAITLSFFAAIVLLFLLFSRFFPILTVWELREAKEEEKEMVEEYIKLHPGIVGKLAADKGQEPSVSEI